MGSFPRGMSTSEDVLFRDAESIEPTEEFREQQEFMNIYPHVPPPRFIACAEDIWQAKKLEVQEEVDEVIDYKELRRIAREKFKADVMAFMDHCEPHAGQRHLLRAAQGGTGAGSVLA